MKNPEPAPGQIWKDLGGNEFIIQEALKHGRYRLHGFGWWHKRVIWPTDTYLGVFAGFKVEEVAR